jgi:hypothetical protein
MKGKEVLQSPLYEDSKYLFYAVFKSYLVLASKSLPYTSDTLKPAPIKEDNKATLLTHWCWKQQCYNECKTASCPEL